MKTYAHTTQHNPPFTTARRDPRNNQLSKHINTQ